MYIEGVEYRGNDRYKKLYIERKGRVDKEVGICEKEYRESRSY